MSFLERWLGPSFYRKSSNKPLNLTFQVKDNPTADLEPSWICINENGQVSLRMLLFRECSGKTRKLYFDSDTVTRTNQIHHKDLHFDLIHDGFGYKYEKSKSDAKDLGEMIYGSIPPSGKTKGFKLHFFKDPEKTMWSSTFGTESFKNNSDIRLGSSFGSNMSVTSLDHSNGSVPFLFELDRESMVDQDSGIYSLSSSGLNSLQNRTPASKLEARHRVSSDCLEMRLRSNSDLLTPTWRNLRINHQQYSNNYNNASISQTSKSNIECTLSHSSKDSTQMFNQGSPIMQDCLSVESQISNTHQKRKRNNVLGLAIIISTSPGLSHVLLENGDYIEQVLQKLHFACLEAFFSGSKFVHFAFKAWVNAFKDVEMLLRVPTLNLTAWKMLSHRKPGVSCSQVSYFVKELKFCIETFEAKEKGFLLSSLLTGVLSRNLGWVTQCKSGKNVTPRYQCLSRREDEILALFGAIGFPRKASKIVLVASESKDLERIIFVLTYFLRSTPTNKTFSNINDIEAEKLDKALLVKKPNLVKVKDEAADKVSFLFGDKTLGMKTETNEENKAENTHVPSEAADFNLTDIYLPLPEDFHDEKKKKNPLPIICLQTPEDLVPNFLVQGLKQSKMNMQDQNSNECIKKYICEELRSSLECQMFKRRNIEEISCVLANLDDGRVELLSANKGFSTNFLDRIFPAPLVTNFVEQIENIISEFEPEVVLNCIEENLDIINRKSAVLSKYLLCSQMPKMEEIYTDLGFDPNDVSFLLALISVHSPEVASKFGLSFI